VEIYIAAIACAKGQSNRETHGNSREAEPNQRQSSKRFVASRSSYLKASIALPIHVSGVVDQLGADTAVRGSY
jgi:hypothetical protein